MCFSVARPNCSHLSGFASPVGKHTTAQAIDLTPGIEETAETSAPRDAVVSRLLEPRDTCLSGRHASGTLGDPNDEMIR